MVVVGKEDVELVSNGYWGLVGEDEKFWSCMLVMAA